jgi:hypothetical protein
MARSSENRRRRSIFVSIRVSKTEKDLALKLAKKSGARSVSAYVRAAILNPPPDDRAIYHQILSEQVRVNALLSAAKGDPRATEEAMWEAERTMRWAMEQR